MGRISALTELTTLATNDYLIVLDSSANIAKKITVANAFGIPDFGWTATGETWTFSSWSSTTRIGVITVPTNATTKYIEGMRVRISQTTGGIKYGIIHDVTATTLSVFFPSGTTLNNETISTPMYSPLDSPFGFDKNPVLWSLSITDTALRQQASPTTNTYYNVGSINLVVGLGVWRASLKASMQNNASGNRYAVSRVAISNANNTSAYASLRQGIGEYQTSGNDTGTPVFIEDNLELASQTTLYANIATSAASTNIYLLGSEISTILKVTSAYL